MAQTVIEATGITDCIDDAIRLAGKGGELILLGSPRGPFTRKAQAVFEPCTRTTRYREGCH